MTKNLKSFNLCCDKRCFSTNKQISKMTKHSFNMHKFQKPLECQGLCFHRAWSCDEYTNWYVEYTNDYDKYTITNGYDDGTILTCSQTTPGVTKEGFEPHSSKQLVHPSYSWSWWWEKSNEIPIMDHRMLLLKIMQPPTTCFNDFLAKSPSPASSKPLVRAWKMLIIV